MKILLTGGCGYVGSVLTEALLNDGHQLTVLDTQWFGNHLKQHPNLININRTILEFHINKMEESLKQCENALVEIKKENTVLFIMILQNLN